jgi:hypothetical protein
LENWAFKLLVPLQALFEKVLKELAEADKN